MILKRPILISFDRNIITLPQGAIPIKINGLSALQLPPGASVKGLAPAPGQPQPTFNLSNLTPCTNAATAILTSPTAALPVGTTATAAKKTKLEVKANLPTAPLPPNLITTAAKVSPFAITFDLPQKHRLLDNPSYHNLKDFAFFQTIVFMLAGCDNQ